MAYTKLVAFDRPLTGTITPGRAGRLYTEAEFNAHGESSYHRGIDAARHLGDQQMVDIRAEVAHLSSAILPDVAHLESRLLQQLHESLPALALDIAKHLLAGYEPPVEVIERLCRDALAQLFPEKENLELILSPRDAELFNRLNPGWIERYPGLKIEADVTLATGDCQVRSRFGLTDGRQQTKLNALARALEVA